MPAVLLLLAAPLLHETGPLNRRELKSQRRNASGGDEFGGT
jgi:hypothetical protein